MPYCPKCRYEYKEGIEHCPDCEVDLVEVLPSEEKREDELRDVEHKIMPLEDEVELDTFTEPVEFMYVASMLDEMDIPYLVRAAKSEKDYVFKRLYSFNNEVKKTIFVSQKDYEKAEEVLESLDAYLMENYEEDEYDEDVDLLEDNEDEEYDKPDIEDYTDHGDY